MLGVCYGSNVDCEIIGTILSVWYHKFGWNILQSLRRSSSTFFAENGSLDGVGDAWMAWLDGLSLSRGISQYNYVENRQCCADHWREASLPFRKSDNPVDRAPWVKTVVVIRVMQVLYYDPRRRITFWECKAACTAWNPQEKALGSLRYVAIR